MLALVPCIIAGPAAYIWEQTDENWQRNIEKTVALEPDSITIYQMELPYNTTITKDLLGAASLERPALVRRADGAHHADGLDEP